MQLVPAAMCLPCLPLVFPAPERPVQMKRELTALAANTLQQPSDFSDTVGNQAYDAPPFAALWRATTKVA